MRRDIDILDLFCNHRYTGYCPICGTKLEYSYGKYGQFAHFITKTLPHYRHYGKAIVDSEYNGIRVCSLQCNNAVQVKRSSRPMLCDRIAQIIGQKIESP